MDGAASVITVVGLALHSTQIVYKTVSGIKHAPRTLQHLTSNLHNLSNVLQQLNGFGDDLQLASELPQLVAGCAKYMREFEAKVSKLCSPKDKKVARLWKNVKATLQEDELDRMSTLLQQHFAVLSLQISIIKGYVVGVILLRDSWRSTNVFSKRLERIENCSNRQATLSATHTTILQSTKSDVDQVNRALGNLQTTSQTSAQTVTNAIDAVGEKVLNAANMSAEQCATLSTRLESILELWKRLDLSEISQQREAKPASREAGETDEQLPGPSDNCLGEALDRLSELVNEKEQTISSTEAESIIEDVDELLAYLLKAEGNHKLHDDRKRKKRAYDEGDDIDVQDAQCKHDLKRMKRILNASDRIALKEKGTHPAFSPDSYLTKTHSRRR